MWIGWSIALISAGLIITAVIICLCNNAYDKKLRIKAESACKIWQEKNGNPWYCTDRDSEEYKQYEKANNKYQNFNADTAVIICVIVWILFGVVFLIGMGVGIAHEVQPKYELIQFEETKAIVEQAYQNGNDFDNMAITQMVIEKNQWIANVKADLRKFGKWSIYWGFDINSVDPIVIHKQGE